MYIKIEKYVGRANVSLRSEFAEAMRPTGLSVGL